MEIDEIKDTFLVNDHLAVVVQEVLEDDDKREAALAVVADIQLLDPLWAGEYDELPSSVRAKLNDEELMTIGLVSEDPDHHVLFAEHLAAPPYDAPPYMRC